MNNNKSPFQVFSIVRNGQRLYFEVDTRKGRYHGVSVSENGSSVVRYFDEINLLDLVEVKKEQ